MKWKIHETFYNGNIKKLRKQLYSVEYDLLNNFYVELLKIELALRQGAPP